MIIMAVDPADLRSGSAQVRAVAERVARSMAAGRGGLVVPGQAGWPSAGQLGAAAAVWAGHLSDLAAGLEQLVADLAALADTLATADREAAGRWRAGVPT